jgi:hypothetical protein
MNPTTLLTNVCYGEMTTVQTHFLNGLAHQLTVQARGTGGNHGVLHPFLSDRITDLIQPLFDAEMGIINDYKIRLLFVMLEECIDVNNTIDV